jgi:hypothetical protein
MYVVVKEQIQTARGSYLQGDNIEETLEIYNCIEDANSRVRQEYEDWGGDAQDNGRGQFECSMTGPGAHYWGSANEEEYIRVYTLQQLVMGLGRRWR